MEMEAKPGERDSSGKRLDAGGNRPAGEEMARKPNILLITGERPCLGLMAEGVIRYVAGSLVGVETAGRSTRRDDPFCQWAMNEIGIDLSILQLEPLGRKDLRSFTHFILVDSSAEAFPLPEEARVEHWRLPDPAKVRGEPSERIVAYRIIRNRVERLAKALIARVMEGQDHVAAR